VHIGVSVGGQWTHIQQSKHHRWSLDDAQISQYHLAGALHPHIRWWEAIEVPRRSVQFVELGGRITLTSLICEDLAQTDEVAGVIRVVGPTMVVTPLLDGPQLSSRWGARYAGVLADDPGSAVLTLTSLGMAQRSRPPGHDPPPLEGPRPAHAGDSARPRRARHPAVRNRRSCGQAQLRRPPARSRRHRILRRERPADPGIQHRLATTPCTSRPATPADADSR
jgi:hypothetical protein